jgi:hypothetical protein
MVIETKYAVGETFWVPRVLKNVEKQELTFEGETWYKDEVSYWAFAKLKKIVCIDIHVGRQINVVYGVKNVLDADNDLTKHYPEANLTMYSEEEAMKIAKQYAAEEKEYYGT